MTQLSLAIRGDLVKSMRQEAKAVMVGSKAATTEATDTLKGDIRGVVRRTFTGGGRGGSRVANAIRGRVYARREGGFTGQVWSKFGRGKGAGFVDYLVPFTKGAEIRPKRSKWLYISLERGKKARRQRRLSVRPAKNLKFIPARGGDKVFIVRETARKTTLIAVLVRRVRIKKSLDFNRPVAKAVQRLPRLVARRIEETANEFR